jgi:tetratricopeptide (TPR) repeat protein
LAAVAVLLVSALAALALGLAAVTRERSAARAALVRARAQHRRAEANLVRALDVMNRLMLTADPDDPARCRGMTAGQRRVAAEAERYYDSLLKEVAADPASRLEEGTIYCYLANVHLQRRSVAAVRETYSRAIAAYRRRAESDPSAWECWAQLGQAHNMLGLALHGLGLPDEAAGSFRAAHEAYCRAAELAPESPPALNYLAWFLASCPDAQLHDPHRAIELAERALRLTPRYAVIWNTLGVALYRAGHWDRCLEALGRSMDLGDGGDGIDWFFMAMALARRGESSRAREFYDRADRWMARSNALDGELRRYREDAAALLGINAESMPSDLDPERRRSIARAPGADGAGPVAQPE